MDVFLAICLLGIICGLIALLVGKNLKRIKRLERRLDQVLALKEAEIRDGK